MKKVPIVLVMILCSGISCRQENSNLTLIRAKAEYYDNIAFTSLQGFTAHLVREEGSSYEVNKVDSLYGRAMIKLRPKPIIEKNFHFGDTIDVVFLKHFMKMGCHYFFSESAFTRCDISFQDSTYTFFKGLPSRSIKMRGMNPNDALLLIGDWKYFAFVRKAK